MKNFKLTPSQRNTLEDLIRDDDSIIVDSLSTVVTGWSDKHGKFIRNSTVASLIRSPFLATDSPNTERFHKWVPSDAARELILGEQR